MKILVLMSFTKEIEYGGYGENDFSEISVIQNLKYCQNHGYDFAVERLDNKYKDLYPSWIKIPIILDYLNKTDYDIVTWIDSDALFLSNMKIEDIHEKNITLTQCVPSEDYENQFTLTSTGYISIRNNEYSKNVFSKLLRSVEEPDFEKYKISYWHEQGLLDKLFIHDELEKCSSLEKDIVLGYKKTCLSNSILTENFKILPHNYQNILSPSKTLFIYHACADLSTRSKRLTESLNYSNI